MLKKRESQPDDQQKIDEAYDKMLDFLANCGIDANFTMGAMFSCMAQGYFDSGYSHQDFCDELDAVKKHYKSWFEK